MRMRRGWLDASPLPGSLVRNIGELLERGRYRSKPYRVLYKDGRERFSLPLLFAPDFCARLTLLPEQAPVDASRVQVPDDAA